MSAWFWLGCGAGAVALTGCAGVATIRPGTAPPPARASVTFPTPSPLQLRLPPDADGNPAPLPPGDPRLLPSPAPTTPAATDARSVAIIAADPRIHVLLGTITYAVTAHLPWQQRTGGVVDGDYVTLRLSRPLAAAGVRLPNVHYDHGDAAPAGEGPSPVSVHEDLADVTSLTVGVDLVAGTVVVIEPTPLTGAIVTDAGGNNHYTGDDGD